MTDLATIPNLALDRAVDEVKLRAIDDFALATVEEITLKTAEKRLAMLEARRGLVLRTFNATDVAKLGDKLAKNKYAAEKLHEIFGGAFEFLKDGTGKPIVESLTIKDDPDVGEYRIFTLFGRYTRPDGKIVEQMGSFSTKDAFFAKSHDTWKTISEVNVVDVMAAAQTETYKKCIFRGVGLGDWTGEEAAALLGEAKGHDFSGSQAAGVRTIVVGFGRAKGQPVVELTDADLTWYVDSYGKNVVDPERARYRKSNQEVLDALTAEKGRRAEKTLPRPEWSTRPLFTPPEVEDVREKMRTDLLDKIAISCQNSGPLIVATIRALSRETGAEVGTLAQLTDDQLTRLVGIDSATLASVVAAVGKRIT